MSVSGNILDMIKYEQKVTQEEIARKVGWHPQRISRKSGKDNFTVAELANIAGQYGYDLTIVSREDGHVPMGRTPGIGRRLIKTIKGRRYDTNSASAMSSSFYEDGENRYTNGIAEELYMDRNNNFFLAVYVENPNLRDNIVPITAEEAAAFIEEHGVKVDKGPKEYGPYDITPDARKPQPEAEAPDDSDIQPDTEETDETE